MLPLIERVMPVTSTLPEFMIVTEKTTVCWLARRLIEETLT